MYKTLKISLTSLLIAAAALTALFVYQAVNTPIVSAQESEAGEQAGQPEETANYTYTAQAGDTYTQVARKAIQTYGIDNNVNLTQAGIVFAETNLTQEADGGELEVGQEVAVDGELVKKWADAAGQLSESEQAAWDVYVPFVNFNTDGVGENKNS
ncbi:MAG: hypothetical protein WD885_02795 [Candidatus Saccharimonadales bacterium]